MGDPVLGSWKLNLAKSKFDPGPAPIRRTDVFEPWERDGVTMRGTITLADGTHITGECSYHDDGKDYKVTGVAGLDTMALKRVDANTTEGTYQGREGS